MGKIETKSYYIQKGQNLLGQDIIIKGNEVVTYCPPIGNMIDGHFIKNFSDKEKTYLPQSNYISFGTIFTISNIGELVAPQEEPFTLYIKDRNVGYEIETDYFYTPSEGLLNGINKGAIETLDDWEMYWEELSDTDGNVEVWLKDKHNVKTEHFFTYISFSDLMSGTDVEINIEMLGPEKTMKLVDTPPNYDFAKIIFYGYGYCPSKTHELKIVSQEIVLKYHQKEMEQLKMLEEMGNGSATLPNEWSNYRPSKIMTHYYTNNDREGIVMDHTGNETFNTLWDHFLNNAQPTNVYWGSESYSRPPKTSIHFESQIFNDSPYEISNIILEFPDLNLGQGTQISFTDSEVKDLNISSTGYDNYVHTNCLIRVIFDQSKDEETQQSVTINDQTFSLYQSVDHDFVEYRWTAFVDLSKETTVIVLSVGEI